jgi:hypothetical protein
MHQISTKYTLSNFKSSSSLKIKYISSELLSVISQKAVNFVVTAVRTSSVNVSFENIYIYVSIHSHHYRRSMASTSKIDMRELYLIKVY